MKIKLPENFKNKHQFERGDKALAVYKDEEMIYLYPIDGYGLDISSDDDNTEILSHAKNGAKVYEIQFLNSEYFSREFPMKLDW